ncbi:MAG: hypothetical protein WBP29_02865 [Candidatus Zixiibacteriota bacterium]
MFFKRKIPVSEYCTTRLDLLFSPQQAELWLQLKRSWPDISVVHASNDVYLTNIRAAHIEVLSMAVTKRSRDIYVSVTMQRSIETYLDQHSYMTVKALLPMYARALASFPPDGILGIAHFLAESVCPSGYSEDTVIGFGGQLYGALESIRGDFKQVKLISDPDPI